MRIKRVSVSAWLSAVVLNFVLAMGLVAPLSAAEEGASQSGAVLVVNINTADVESLAAGLKGVGEKRARDIVAWREANGDFTSIEQLLEIKGIGPKLLEKNRQLLKID